MGIHRQIVRLFTLHFLSIYILDTYNKHGFCLFTGLCACWFPMCFACHSCFYGWLPSELVHVSSWILQLSVRYYYTGYNNYAHYLAILGFGCFLQSYKLCIIGFLLSACLSFFSFILIKYLILWIYRTYLRPLVGIFLFMDNIGYLLTFLYIPFITCCTYCDHKSWRAFYVMVVGFLFFTLPFSLLSQFAECHLLWTDILDRIHSCVFSPQGSWSPMSYCESILSHHVPYFLVNWFWE